MDFINLPLLLLSAILVFSILTSFFSSRANIPLLFVFLCIGLVLGDGGGLGLIAGFHQPKMAFFIGSVALALILFDSGYQTPFKSYRRTLFPSVLLATLGVFFTALFLAPAAHFILGFDWPRSFLMASVISSTDAAAVFFLLRMSGVAVRDRIKSTLEMESGSNDPMAIFLTFAFLSLIHASYEESWYSFLIFFVLQMGIGLIAGGLLGTGMRLIINKFDFDTALYPVLLLGMVLLGFATVNLLNGSGFLALYVAGVFMGSAPIRGRHQILRFQSTLTWFSQIVLFLTLGFFANISELTSLLIPAILLSVFLIFLARPLAVFLCLLPYQYTTMEKIFISFVGLRGATSILMALAPMLYSIEGAHTLFNVIFLMVLISLAVQGFFITPMAKYCHVVLPLFVRPPEKTEIDLPGLSDSYLITYKLSAQSPVVQGATVPRWATPVWVQRGDISYMGASVKKFEAGDQVYVFASTEEKVPLLDKLFGETGASSEGENMGDFVIYPDILMKELAYLYNIQIPNRVQEQSLREVLEKNFIDLEIGDRFVFKNIELIVRQKNEGVITEVGISLQPSKKRQSFGRLFNMKRRTLK